jgi:hypothetical protein
MQTDELKQARKTLDDIGRRVAEALDRFSEARRKLDDLRDLQANSQRYLLLLLEKAVQ